jgi:CMP-N,N'-diacetyllegionaminic acid synthase
MKNDKRLDNKIICIIPARGGSKGLIRKNVRDLNGKPLIGWTIDEAKKSHWIDRILVSTDDKEIADVSIGFGAEVIRRPAELAQDSSTTIDAVLHTLDILESTNYRPEYTLLLQCTSPLRTVSHIDEAIKKFLENIEIADSLVSVSKVGHPPWWYKKLDTNGYISDFIKYDKKSFTRRQDFPDVYNTNGAVFIAKTQMLNKVKDFEMERTLAYVMDSDSSIDIDSEMDFIIAECIMNIKNT